MSLPTHGLPLCLPAAALSSAIMAAACSSWHRCRPRPPPRLGPPCVSAAEVGLSRFTRSCANKPFAQDTHAGKTGLHKLGELARWVGICDETTNCNCNQETINALGPCWCDRHTSSCIAAHEPERCKTPPPHLSWGPSGSTSHNERLLDPPPPCSPSSLTHRPMMSVQQRRPSPGGSLCPRCSPRRRRGRVSCGQTSIRDVRSRTSPGTTPTTSQARPVRLRGGSTTRES